ncbi:BTB/POZ domain-containing protein 3 [Collichthys lucidus]|uniref:BTB/POZ domain-containing protein 3 n=1 Tax=Collichthys lucidus TaxID=240159 RepID=A0A4U5VBF7_COLLU|nr:BTB/POZ domain-containing protein 3 [Collichthys lucidus]
MNLFAPEHVFVMSYRYNNPVTYSGPSRSEEKGLKQELSSLFLKGETSYRTTAHTAQLVSSPQVPLSPPSHLPDPGECLLCLYSHCSAVEHTHGRCQGKEHEMSDFLLNASMICYEIITLRSKKKKKMAADIFPTKKPASTTTVQQYQQQNLNNNNTIQNCNWQGLYSTIRERNSVMFNNELMADVHFVVGQPGRTQRLPGHRVRISSTSKITVAYVLAVGSSVFHAMFYGELAENKDEIHIPDVEPAAFLAMLKPWRASYSERHSTAKEIVVFEAVLNWAEAECQRQELTSSTDNKRKVLGKAMYLIRIPTMALDDFANGAAQSGVLTLTETNDIFLWYTAAKKPDLEFVSQPRKGLTPQRCHRFQSCAYRSNQWRYRGRCDSIQFAVDKRVFIAGFGLYGSSCGSAEYSAKIELKRQGVLLGQNLSKYFSDGSSNTFPVWFEYPVQIEPDTFYTASVILDGNELSYFGQEGMTEVQCGKVTFQFQCSSDSTNGTGVQGGQIPELIFYA